jgi:hypothetical protein
MSYLYNKQRAWTNKLAGSPTETRKQMSEAIAPTIGSEFVTQRAGIKGIVQEVIKNATGTYRVRLDVDGDSRWTTVK